MRSFKTYTNSTIFHDIPREIFVGFPDVNIQNIYKKVSCFMFVLEANNKQYFA